MIPFSLLNDCRRREKNDIKEKFLACMLVQLCSAGAFLFRIQFVASIQTSTGCIFEHKKE